ncbi:hypothetical protein E0H82_00840 [Acinetobacter sp. ANC 4910]|uniref:hypothetical protein n=1 Tax=Acinetobacter sp. ANC 4910 TaxID=2529850 RepID=UPI00103CE832|nr:hypothetical protein [Acinetobacter sp. ANC 4910]TCB38170.1 hypothetical protein E0H82_00840 [Acinetobacter sp. ANC 4910]
MKELFHNPLKLFLVWVITVFLVASYGRFAYAYGVHPHGELALVGYYYKGAYSPLRAFFMRYISMRLHIVMAELEGDTFECAGFLCSQSTNPFQFCHPHLVVNGKAPIYKGAH